MWKGKNDRVEWRLGFDEQDVKDRLKKDQGKWFGKR